MSNVVATSVSGITFIRKAPSQTIWKQKVNRARTPKGLNRIAYVDTEGLNRIAYVDTEGLNRIAYVDTEGLNRIAYVDTEGLNRIAYVDTE
jgi:hypothetical protein